MRTLIVFNRDASTLKTADQEGLRDLAQSLFADARIEMMAGDAMPDRIRDAVSGGAVDRLLVAGGDGTVSFAAGQLAGTAMTLGIIPGGNMNLFARSLGLPLEPEAALHALASGEPAAVDIAYANDRPFIHEFSLGLHPQLIEERDKARFGSRLGKIVGTFRAGLRAISRPARVRVWIDDDDDAVRNGAGPVATAGLAVTNNPLGAGHLPYADRLDAGCLGVYIVRSDRPGDLVALAAGLHTGRWQQLDFIEQRCATQLTVRRRRSMKAALDGELVKFGRRVRLRVEPGGLTVLRPKESIDVQGDAA